MSRKSKTPYFYSLLLLLVCVATNFISVKGWCIDNGNTSAVTHITLVDCHSNVSMRDDISLCNVATTRTTDNNHCTTCYDLTPEILAAQLFDDPIGSLVSAPPTNNIFYPQQYSELKSFYLASPGDGVTIDQSSSRQTQQNKAIRTVVLLV